MSQDVDVRSSVDRAARRFLAAVEFYGGEATTTEIRRRTGLSRTETNHRFARLEDLGLIEVSYAEVGRGDRDPPKVAHLTGKARAEIERGLLYDIDRSRNSEEIHDLVAEVRALREDIDRLETRVDVLNDSLHGLDDDLDWMMGEWAEAVETTLGGIRDALEAEDIDREAVLREHEERMCFHMHEKGKSYAEIAALLPIPESTVGRRVRDHQKRLDEPEEAAA